MALGTLSLALVLLATVPDTFAATQSYSLNLNTGQVAPDGFERT